MTGYQQNNFMPEQFTPTAITATLPPTVTIIGSNFTNGQAVRCTQFLRYPLANATGMEQLNNKLFYVQHATADTFDLYDVNDLPIDGRNFTPFINGRGAQMTRTGPDLFVQNTATTDV